MPTGRRGDWGSPRIPLKKLADLVRPFEEKRTGRDEKL